MIVLDTNVLSALMRAAPDAEVAAWVDSVNPAAVWTTAVTVFEIEYGLALLEPGRRRSALENAFAAVLAEDLQGRVLAFDKASARAAAQVASTRRRTGRPVEIRDTQIAGIALAHGAALATRNISDFEGVALALINPWSGARG